MREWNGRYRDDQRGGLAWLLRQEEGVVVDVVDHSGISGSLRVYRREEGGRNSKYRANRCMTGNKQR